MHIIMQEFHENTIKPLIAEYGHAVVSTEGGDDPGYPFSYTIGLQKENLPELLVIGITGESGVWLLNEIAKRLRELGKPFEDETLIDLGGKFPVKIMSAPHPRVRDLYTIQAGQHFTNESYSVQQILIPDLDGIFPDEPNVMPKYRVPMFKAN